MSPLFRKKLFLEKSLKQFCRELKHLFQTQTPQKGNKRQLFPPPVYTVSKHQHVWRQALSPHRHAGRLMGAKPAPHPKMLQMKLFFSSYA